MLIVLAFPYLYFTVSSSLSFNELLHVVILFAFVVITSVNIRLFSFRANFSAKIFIFF